MPGIGIGISPELFPKTDGALVPVVPYIVSESNAIISRNGDNIVLTFEEGNIIFNVISNLGNYSLDYIACAGGGAGGATSNGGGAGGGAGEIFIGNFIPTVQIYTGTIGGGGQPQSGTFGENGEDTVIFGNTLAGGSGGGDGDGDPDQGVGRAGNGNIGGNGFNCPTIINAAGPGFFNGGVSTGDGGGGGGGMAGNGVNCDTAMGGNGGIGILSSITGSAIYYGCGGGGGSYLSLTGSSGGNNFGGNGGYGTITYTEATIGLSPGCGGGGAGKPIVGGVQNGAAGNAGVVIITYFFPETVETFTFQQILQNG